MILSCSVCHRRNYYPNTVRKPQVQGRFQIKKFCPYCNTHTMHVDTP
ncbi:MAG: 50S ribosomal protein L33 [Vampirovibrionales bacterium]